MIQHFSFKHMEPSDALRKYAEEKAQRLAKYFRGRTHLTWHFSVEKQNRIIHCHLLGNQMDFFGEAKSEDFLASIDMALERIEKQIRKRKEIVKDHLHKNQRLPQAS